MLRHFLDDFMSFVPLQMPQLLNVATMEEPQFYGDYVLLTFPLRDPYDLEEVMDILSIATAIQSNKRTEFVSCVHVSRIEPRITNTFQRT